MANTLGDFRNYVDSFLREERRFSKTERESFIEEAIQTYSKDRPDIVVADLTGDATSTLSLPSDWEDGFSSIESVEYPTGNQFPTILKPSAAILYRSASTTVSLRFLSIIPGSGETVRLTYTIRHVVDDSGSTIEDGYWRAVAKLAVSKAALALATQYMNIRDPQRGNIRISNEARALGYENLADRLMREYISDIGGDPDSGVQPAHTSIDVDPSVQHGLGHITHQRR